LFRASHNLHPRRANRSLQIVHVLGGRERPCAPGTIASCIEPLGARQGHRKNRLRPFLGSFDGGWRWLPVDLRTDRLRREWSGVRFACGLSLSAMRTR